MTDRDPQDRDEDELKVTDRRQFTADGELRPTDVDGEPAPQLAPPQASEPQSCRSRIVPSHSG